jgi:hypothetical protein
MAPRNIRIASIATASALALTLLAGCGTNASATGSPPASEADLARVLEQFGLDSGDWTKVTENESNDLFGTATSVDLSHGQAAVAGQITNTADIDIYDIGPIYRGDRIIVTSMVSGDLDATAALFNTEDCLIYANDDRIWNVDSRPYINFVVRQDSSHCSLGLAASEGTEGSGQYGLWIQIEAGNVVPDAQTQVVVLDFDGAQSVSVGGMNVGNISAFNAADIDDSLAGQTSQVVNQIEATVREDYADYDVEIYSTAEGDLPDEPYTSVYFGEYNPYLLGLADYVDYYNRDLTQESIVFTETFKLFMPYRPGASEMAQVIGNVASHELGHLLGLNHTADPTELMDSTATAGQMLDDQDFHRAALKAEVFPAGYQDSGQLLAQTVGRR